MEKPAQYSGAGQANGSGAHTVADPDLLLFAPPGGQDFTFIDLFAGIGGMRKAFSAVGGDCAYSSEWDESAQKTYIENYGDTPAGDIRKVNAHEIPKHDVLLAGFPCQPFSIAGVTKKNALGRPHGFACHTQGTLFYEVQRIIEHHRPAAFLLENVKNLTRHDKGNTFRIIRQVLEADLGYHMHYRVIDAKGFVPQHRERIIMVGFRERTDFDINRDPVIPEPDAGPKLRAILHPEDGTERPEAGFTVGPEARVNDKYTLTDHLWRYLQDYAAKHRAKGNGFGFGLVGPDDVARTLSARYYKDGSEILVRQEGRNPRRLTPRECARLMGYPEEFVIPVSDTQAYKQFGNSVVVPLIQAVARAMKPYIVDAASEPTSQMASSERQLVGTL